jgi:hypothetical protein
MIDHRAGDPAASHRLGGVHGLQLRVVPVKLLQCPDAEELTVVAEAEERDGRIEETINVKCMDVLGRAVRIGECEVALEQFVNIVGSRVVNRDLALRHGRSIRAAVPRPDRSNRASAITLPVRGSETVLGKNISSGFPGPRGPHWRGQHQGDEERIKHRQMRKTAGHRLNPVSCFPSLGGRAGIPARTCSVTAPGLAAVVVISDDRRETE